MKIKTNLPHRFGQIITIANIDVKFNEKGIAEVDSKDISAILFSDPTLVKEETAVEKKIREEKEKQEIIAEQKKQEELENLRIKTIEEYNKLVDENKPLNPDTTFEDAQKALFDFKQEEVRKKQKISQDLAPKTVEELQKIAKDAELPKKDWEKLKKLELIKYLVDKI